MRITEFILEEEVKKQVEMRRLLQELNEFKRQQRQEGLWNYLEVEEVK